MNESIVIGLTTLKTFFINIFTYLIFFKSINYKKLEIIKIIQIILASAISTYIYICLKKYIGQIYSIIGIYFLQSLFLKIIIGKNIDNVLIKNLVANSVAYVCFGIAMIIELFIVGVVRCKSLLINTIFILIIEAVLIIFIFKTKRFKNGFSFLNNNTKNDYMDIILINISLSVILAYCLFGNYYGNLTRHILISFIILGIIMFIMIQKTLILYYKQKLLEKTMEDYEEEIKQKDEIIKELSEEKFKISKVNHEFYNRQKSLEKAVKDFINNTSTEMGNELTIINKINNLTAETQSRMQGTIEKITNDQSRGVICIVL